MAQKASLEIWSFPMVLIRSKESKLFFSDGKLAGLRIRRNKHQVFRKLQEGDTCQFRCEVRYDKDSHGHKYLQIDNILEVVKTDFPSWSLLKECYGVVVKSSVSNDKLEVFNPEYGLIRTTKDFGGHIEQDDFVRFHLTTQVIKDKLIYGAVNFLPCSKEEALISFENNEVAINYLDDDRMVFNYASPEKNFYGEVSFKDTTLRPILGDIYRIYYCEYKYRNRFIRKIVDYERIEKGTDDTTTVRGQLVVRYKSKRQAQNSKSYPSFGFVNQKYFIPGMHLKNANIREDCYVAAHMVLIDGKPVVFEVFPLGR